MPGAVDSSSHIPKQDCGRLSQPDMRQGSGQQPHMSSDEACSESEADSRERQELRSSRIRGQEQLAKRLMACGEVLLVARPLLYVALLRRWGPRSWRPWLLAALVELLSRSATLHGAQMLQQNVRLDVLCLDICIEQ